MIPYPKDGGTEWTAGCKTWCKQGKNKQPDPSKCSKMYVDCSLFGGYDPEDACKQTCLRPYDAYNYCRDDCGGKTFLDEVTSDEY